MVQPCVVRRCGKAGPHSRTRRGAKSSACCQVRRFCRFVPALAFASLLLGGIGVAAQPSAADEVLGVRVGQMIAEATVPASGVLRTVALTNYAGREVVIVVRGQFVYSQRPGFPLGRQDAKYRWGSRHPEKVCLPCVDPSREDVSFVIDGGYREPTREDFESHTYVYVYRVSDSGVVTFQIRDDIYVDNDGELKVTIYERP